MYRIIIDREKCEGCGECVDACPAGILGMVDNKADVVGDPDDCLGCEACVAVCPSEACVVEES
jgi:NAD-dependent dihydropyrimidine dehydrogenase PreA subunit